jgi:hypothetical protein
MFPVLDAPAASARLERGNPRPEINKKETTGFLYKATPQGGLGNGGQASAPAIPIHGSGVPLRWKT